MVLSKVLIAPAKARDKANRNHKTFWTKVDNVEDT